MDYNKFVPNSCEVYMGLCDNWTDKNGHGIVYDLQIMYGNKRKFAEELGELLHKHHVNDVISMDYFLDYPNRKEIVRINYNGGGHHYVNVSGNSEYGMLEDIIYRMR